MVEGGWPGPEGPEVRPWKTRVPPRQTGGAIHFHVSFRKCLVRYSLQEGIPP